MHNAPPARDPHIDHVRYDDLRTPIILQHSLAVASFSGEFNNLALGD